MAFVELEKKGAIGIITMNRPEALNALNDQVLQDLSDVLDQVETDPESWSRWLPGRAGPSWQARISARCPASLRWRARLSELTATAYS